MIFATVAGPLQRQAVAPVAGGERILTLVAWAEEPVALAALSGDEALQVA